jgi:adenosylcobinamide-GDP ribazoletransferase
MMPHRALNDLTEGVALLTRLPVPDHAPRGGSSAWGWPLVGAGLGAICAAVGLAATAAGVPAEVAAGLVLAAQAMLTGGLHEDGLADTADGLFGGRTPARRLEIMKDSRVGSYGVLALVIVTLCRWSALTALVAGGALLPALVAAGALSRAPMAMVMALLPNARGNGFSHATGRPPVAVALAAVGLALGVAVATTGFAGLAMATAAILTALWVAQTARARIGGQTGDILGATQQLAEVAVLSVAAVLLV